MHDIVLCVDQVCARQRDEQKSLYGVIKPSKLKILYCCVIVTMYTNYFSWDFQTSQREFKTTLIERIMGQ